MIWIKLSVLRYVKELSHVVVNSLKFSLNKKQIVKEKRKEITISIKNKGVEWNI